MMQSDNIGTLAAALAAAQAELTNPIKKKTAKAGQYSYNYADMAEVLDTVRPTLAKHGIALTQPTILSEDVLIVQTRLSHASGEFMASDYPVCRISGDHQKMGAAMTYARRYSLCSMIGVAADDDTDGQGAAEAAPKKSARGPDWGKSSQAKKRGDWDIFMDALKDCQSASEIDRLEQEYEKAVYHNWSPQWRSDAKDEFEKYRADFKEPGEALTLREQLEGSVEAEKAEPTRTEYLAYCFDTANVFTNRGDANAWWAEQAAARKRYRLTPAEESDIRACIKASLDKPETTFVPNARERAELKDKAGNTLHPVDAG